MTTAHPHAVPGDTSIPDGRFSNNFDFLRFAAALAVVAAHAYALRLGYIMTRSYSWGRRDLPPFLPPAAT